MKPLLLVLSALFSLVFVGESVAEASLVGSKESVQSSFAKAQEEHLDFLKTGASILDYVKKGYRVTVKESVHLDLDNDVSYPYAVSAVELFARRLASQYFGACRAKLVVTSLMRPLDEQPDNASDFSVHPAGMAIDLRIPAGECRDWLERTLLTLEKVGVLDATRETRPPHYHVVVYPSAYEAYVRAKLEEGEVSDNAWLQSLLAALFPALNYVLLGLVVAIGIFFLLRRTVRRKRTVKRGKWKGRVQATIVLILLLLGSSTTFLYLSLPHPGWDVRGSELTALATTLYWESAIVDSVEGRRAIAFVIFNRQALKYDYPDSIREIVTEGAKPGKKDGCQFSFACDLQNEMPDRLCELHPVDTKRLLGPLGCTGRYLENLVLAAWLLYTPHWFDPTGGATHYYTGAVPYWITDCEKDPVKIGYHYFCRSKWAN